MTAHDHLSIAGLEGYLAELGAESRPPAPRPIVLSPAAMQFLKRNVTLSAATRSALQQALSEEYVAARAMTDEVFWGYDQAWNGLGAPSLIETRRAGGCGGGGCNISYNNNQYWSLAQACDRGVFSLVMYQQRRYIAAQNRIRRHLAAVPQQEIVQGFDRMPGSSSVRDACAGVRPKDKAIEWAYWCEEALRLIGVARWSSNFSWSDGFGRRNSSFGWGRLNAEWRTCGDASWALTSREYSGDNPGCEYAPDCSQDAFGVARLGYIAGKMPNGIAQWREVVRPLFQFDRRERGPEYEAARIWDTGRDNPLFPGFGVDTWPLSVAPKVLGLHRTDRSQTNPAPAIPMQAGDFNGAWIPGLQWPTFLQKGSPDIGSSLLAYFLEIPLSGVEIAGWEEQFALRERYGCWFYRRDVEWATFLYQKRLSYAPASEMLIWWLIAQLRDIEGLSFGQLVIDGFDNLSRALQGIPAEFRGALFDQQAGLVRAGADRIRAQGADQLGGIFAGVGAVATAIAPIAGLVVSLVGAAVVALVRFAIDVGLVRVGNPPALQMPAMRVAPPTPEGDDRCWINPGATEALDAYKVRVADPFAEAARRAGGDPGRLFDLVPKVRVEQFCQRNPTHPRCVAPPRPPGGGGGGGDVKGGGGGLLIGAAALLLLSRFLR